MMARSAKKKSQKPRQNKHNVKRRLRIIAKNREILRKLELIND